MKFRTKLYLGFGIILALLVVFSYIVFHQLSLMNRDMHVVVNDSYANVRLANVISRDINDLSMEVNESLLDIDVSLFQSRIKMIEEYKYKLSSNMVILKSLIIVQPESKELVGRIDFLYNSYVQGVDNAIDLLKAGKKVESVKWHNDEVEPLKDRLFETLTDFNQLQESSMESSLEQSSDAYVITVRFIAILVSITIFAGVATAVGVFRSLTRSLELIVSVMHRAARSERAHLPRIHIKTKDELGSITEAFNLMAAALETSASQEQQHYLSLQQLGWHKSKIAEITTLYPSIVDIKKLAKLFITEAASIMGASYGVFYLRQESGSELPRYVKVASYAGSQEDIGLHSITLGEGLVGQCAMEGKEVIVDTPPEDYIQIYSGLGSAAPAQIVILPIKFEQGVVAVIELATIQRFADNQLSLLNELLVTLGIKIKSIMDNMQVEELLKESQVFTEELQTQSEELQLQQEELKTLNEQLEEQYKKSRRKGKELEKARDELEEKNRQISQSSKYKSEFLANMSHELRTPLNSLLILSQILSENKEGNLTSKQLEFTRTIHASGTDLLNLINEVLDLSKIESGKMELAHDLVKMEQIADQAERRFSAIAAEKGIQFNVEIQQALADLSIYTDLQKLQQIVFNLLSNAFKFTVSGSVSLRFKCVMGSKVPMHPTLPAEEVVLAIEIADTGIGIAQDKQAIIFSAFQQADGTTSRNYGGTGLGLAISQKIAELLGGMIYLDSEEGRGSTFIVFLPIDNAHTGVQNNYEAEAAAAFAEEAFSGADSSVADGEAESKEDRNSQLKGNRILLIDDDMRNIYALTTVLESHGIHVIFAENGQEGIDQLLAHPETDLVLMDIMMPKMDGYEATKEIRKLDQYKDLPIIALTAKAMKHDRERCIEAGASDYISKPVNLEQLLSLIRVWLHR